MKDKETYFTVWETLCFFIQFNIGGFWFVFTYGLKIRKIGNALAKVHRQKQYFWKTHTINRRAQCSTK